MSICQVQLPWLEHFTPLTQPTQFYTELQCSFVEKKWRNGQEGCWEVGAPLSAACWTTWLGFFLSLLHSEIKNKSKVLKQVYSDCCTSFQGICLLFRCWSAYYWSHTTGIGSTRSCHESESVPSFVSPPGEVGGRGGGEVYHCFTFALRWSSQSAPENSLLLEKPPTVNKNYDQP